MQTITPDTAPLAAAAVPRAFLRDVSCIATLLAFSLLFMSRAFLSGSPLGLYPSDGTRIHYFVREFVSGELSAGRLPLWNPYTQFGAPFLANMQWGVFSPLNLLIARLPADVGYNGFVLANVAMAGVFMFLLARQWKLSRPASLVAALAFMFSGRLISWAWGGALFMLSAIAWLPLVVLLCERAMSAQTRRLRWIALAAVAAAAQVLSGHPQVTFFSGCVLAVLVLDRMIETRDVRVTIVPLAIAVLAVGLSAVQLLPTYEAMGLSTRAFEWKSGVQLSAIEGSYNPLRLITWIIPDLFGNAVSLRPAATDWLSLVFREAHSDEFRAYIGVAPLIAALFSLTKWRSERRVAMLWVLTIGSLLAALGRFTPLYGFIYAAVPPLRTFRIPARFLTITVFAAALLAGFGVDALSDAEPGRLRSWTKSLAVAAAALIAAVAVAGVFHRLILAHAIQTAAPLFSIRPAGRAVDAVGRIALIEHAFVLAARSALISSAVIAATAAVFWSRAMGRHMKATSILLLAITAVDLAAQASMYTSSASMNEFFAKNARLVRLLRSSSVPARSYTWNGLPAVLTADMVAPNDNAFIHERLFTGSGYDSFELSTYRTAADSIDTDLREGSEYFASLFGLRYIVTNVGLENTAFRRVANVGAASVYENTKALPRAYIAGHARRAAHNQEAFDILRTHDLQLGRDVVVESTEPLATGGSMGGRVVSVATAAASLQAEVQMDGDGYLVVNDSYYPGWTATVDGTETRLFRANGHVRAVAVSGGRHSVLMRFEPRSLRFGALVSLAFIAVTLALAVLPL
jgi:hypothetical protein